MVWLKGLGKRVTARRVVIVLAAVVAVRLGFRLLQSEVSSFREDDGFIASRLEQPILRKRRPPQLIPRRNMRKCKPIFGKLTVFVVLNSSATKKFVLARDSLKCYIASTNYELVVVNPDTDSRVKAHCNHSMIYFRKHCAAAAYLVDTEWMLVLDADTAVVNPDHCVEEYVDPRVNLIFYERFFSKEIMSGNYLVRNSKYSHDFLMRWANHEFSSLEHFGYDNGALHIVVLQSVISPLSQEVANCDKIWAAAKSFDEYIVYVMCVRLYLGAATLFPGKLKFVRRAHAFARDGFITDHRWCSYDFMFHGVKQNTVGEWKSPFKEDFNVSTCGAHYNGWKWRSDSRVDVETIRNYLSDFEKRDSESFVNKSFPLPFFSLPDVSGCYPHCQDEEADLSV